MNINIINDDQQVTKDMSYKRGGVSDSIDEGEVNIFLSCFLLFCSIYFQIFGYRRHLLKYVLTVTAVVCSGGVLALLFYWIKQWWIYCTHSPCSLEEASVILVVVKKHLSKTTFNMIFQILLGKVQKLHHLPHQDSGGLIVKGIQNAPNIVKFDS